MDLCLILLTPTPQFLQTRIAGLTLLARWQHTARKAGIDEVFFLGGGEDNYYLQSQQQLQELQAKNYIVLPSGLLADVDYLKSLKKIAQQNKSLITHPNLPLLIISEQQEDCKKDLWEDRNIDSIAAKYENSCATEITSGKIYDVRETDMHKLVEKELFRGLIKDTEGFMSKHFERKISLFISSYLVNTPLTPNQMTIFSVILGIVGAFFITMGQGFWQICGALLFLAHSILDGCDGEIARLKFQESKWGGLLDFWGDNVVHSCIFAAIGFEWWQRSHDPLALASALSAVLATIACASWIYWHTMRDAKGDGPLYTSVSTVQTKSKINKVADFLSRRDFIYLVVILAIFRHLDWFLMCTAIGTPLFFIALLWIHFTSARPKLDHAYKSE